MRLVVRSGFFASALFLMLILQSTTIAGIAPLPSDIYAQAATNLTLDVSQTTVNEGDTVIFSGYLQTLDGTPLQSAEIKIVVVPSGTEIVSLTTEADGSYQYAWEAHPIDGDQIMAQFEGSPEYYGANSSLVDMHVEAEKEVTLIELQDISPLFPSPDDIVTFTGYLHDAYGVGLSGQPIMIYGVDYYGIAEDDPWLLAEAITDSEGNFQAEWQAVQLSERITTWALFEGSTLYTESESGGWVIDIAHIVPTVLHLEPPPNSVVGGETVIFEGYLETEEGTRVEGATISIYIEDAEGFGGYLPSVTDSDGTFYYEWDVDLTASPITIYASYEGGLEGYYASTSETYEMHVSEPQAVQTLLYLDKPPSSVLVGDAVVFTGYLEASNGQRIADATISIYAQDSLGDERVLATGLTDSNGEFETIWDSEYLGDFITMYAYFAGNEEYAASQSQIRSMEITVSVEDIETQLTIESGIPSSISEGALLEIEGSLFTIYGDPVENAPVVIYAYDGSQLYTIATAYTDSDGDFDAVWQAEYLSYSVVIAAYFGGAENLLSSESEAYVIYLLSDQPSTTILYLEAPEFTLSEGQEIPFTGYIVDENYQPISGAVIEITGYDVDYNTFPLATAVSDSDGDFETDWEVEYLADYIGIYAYFAGNDDFVESYSYSHVVEILPKVQVYDVDIFMSTELETYYTGDVVNVDAALSDVYEGDVLIDVYNGYDWLYASGPIAPDPDGAFDFYFTLAGEDDAQGSWRITAYYLGNEETIYFDVIEREITPEDVEQEPFEVTVDGQSFIVYAYTSSGTISEIWADTSDGSIVLEVEPSFYEGEVIITLPRELIDSQDEDGNDLDFLAYGWDPGQEGYYELYYEEFPGNSDERVLKIFLPPEYDQIYILGTRLASSEVSEIDTVLVLNEPMSDVTAGEVVTFTGTLSTAENEQPVENALVWILDYDESESDSINVLGWGLTDGRGMFSVDWTATSLDGDVDALAFFEGSNSKGGDWFKSYATFSFQISINPSGITVRPQEGDPYIDLYGVWDKDPIRVAVIQYEGVPEEYGEDIDFAFEEWSNILKRASGNSQAWNFEVVKNSRQAIYETPPDIIVEIRMSDDDLELKCTEVAGYATIFQPNTQQRFFNTVPSVVYAACDGELIPHEDVRRTALHELAHAFGLGHTWFRDYDMMCSAEYIDGEWVPTCANIFPKESGPSALAIDAILYMYGKDGFAEPNLRSIPPFFVGDNVGGFVHLDVTTDKEKYAEGETALVTVQVSDGYGNPTNVQPSISGLGAEPQQLGTGRYLFNVSVAGEDQKVTVSAGDTEVAVVLNVSGSYSGGGNSAHDVSLNTDRNSFATGETITITGSVGNVQEPVLVNVEVKSVDGQTVFSKVVETDGNGNFALQFEIPESAGEGDFAIFATTVIGGQTASSRSTVNVASQAPPTSQCIIATAAFGSELAPQVQFLRDFRDNRILSTAAGSSFMNAFNSWYYSFSPQVADYERDQPWLQATVRAAIYPLLGILTVSEQAYALMPGEYGAVTAGIVASFMIGAVYFWPAAIAVQRFGRNDKKMSNGLAIVLIGMAIVAATISVLVGNSAALIVTTSFLVLTIIAISAIFSARLMKYAVNWFTKIACQGWSRYRV